MLEPLHGSVPWRLVVSLLLLLPGPSLAQSPASQVVTDAAAALGGRDRIAAARTLLLEGVGKEFSFGQGSSWSEMGQEASAWKVISYRRAYDLPAGRARFEQSRTPLYAFFAGHIPGKSVDGLDGDVAYTVGEEGGASSSIAIR